MSTIQHHPTFDIIDSSKLITFMDCPRQYFYRYILGWRPDQPEHHLAFGTAWHAAMEHLLLNGYDKDNVAAAFNKFMEAYRREIPADVQDLEKKSPDSALRALVEYVHTYRDDQYTTLYTEISGRVPVGENRFLNFRLDNVLQDEHGQYLYMDHKTGSQLSRQWRDQWINSIQMATYLHVLYCCYEEARIYGGIVNGTFFYTKDIKFERVPVRKDRTMMHDYLITVNYWLDLIEHSMEALDKAKEGDTVLTAFPKNPNACTKYFGCPYLHLCSSWANPLQRCNDVPSGMVVQRWDPSAMDQNSKTVYVDGTLRKVEAQEQQG